MKKLLLFICCYSLVYFTISSTINSRVTREEKKFVVVIPSYNNKKWYDHNLASVLSQHYSNFRIIYTDDCSPDGTGALVQSFLENNDPHRKVTLIQNPSRKGALHNLYTMIHSCDDDEIIVTLDGDDWLPDDNVLSRLNEIYSTQDVWLTYGQFELHPSGIKGWACEMPDYIIENNAFRAFQHLPTHLRTFYSWLFKKIKTEDLLYLGKFYPMTWDMAMMFPMIEMAGERHQFIPEVMYIYNDENSISDHHVSRQLQAYLAQILKSKKRYQRLLEQPRNVINTQKADVIIFAESPEKLSQCIDSLYTYVTERGTISVMFKPLTLQEKKDYQIIENVYPEINFYLINDHRINFQETLLTIYNNSLHDYILFSKGDTQFNSPLSLSNTINLLQTIPAYAFYFKLNAKDGISKYNHMPIIECRPHIFMWNFSLAHDKWTCANSLDLVLHKKTDSLLYALKSYYDRTPNGLESVWANEGNLDCLGLCFNDYSTQLIQ